MIINSKNVKDFKDACNENHLIPVILKTKLSNYFLEPVLDVGSGMGEIMTRAFPEKRIIHIDIDDFSRFGISSSHSREMVSFFDYNPKEKIGTIFMSHVLQFLDDDILRLNQKILEIKPEYLIEVANTNKDFMADLLIWFKNKAIESNPEETLVNFPLGYQLIEVAPFTATVALSDFNELATQISYLFDTKLNNDQLSSLVDYLKVKCERPGFTIDQEIRVYKKK